jgi:transcriptional regulator with XRE-family HTH domain
MPSSLHNKHYKKIVARLTAEREARGVSQIEMARQLGVTQSSVSKIERAERRLDIYEFVQWCDALGISPATIFRDHEAPKRREVK